MRTISLLVAFCLIQSLQAKNINITDLGARPDATTLCIDLIQKAVDDCSSSGGGTVTIPAGVFLTGTIVLKNNVILNLESGAILLGSKKIEDYKPGNLIRALNAQNIGITGNGAIDGQGHVFWIPMGEKTFRPGSFTFAHNRPAPGELIQLEGCKRSFYLQLSGS
jgi:polygalacturonase